MVPELFWFPGTIVGAGSEKLSVAVYVPPAALIDAVTSMLVSAVDGKAGIRVAYSSVALATKDITFFMRSTIRRLFKR